MKYYSDGYMINSNPSNSGGYTIIDQNNVFIDRQQIYKSNFTNNEAEILGIVHAMKYASYGDTVSTDSMCCLTWANKGRSKARPDLVLLLQEARDLKKTKNINLMWEGREWNLAGIYNEKIGGKIRRKQTCNQ